MNQPALIDQATALAPVEQADIFERLLRDPEVSADKVERFMALWERGEAKKAEGAFNVAMSAAQSEMRPVAADADNPQTRSKYASYAALDKALRPVYTKHGFGLSFNTGETPSSDVVRVLCYVSHVAGHSREYHIDMPADGKGAKGGDVMTKTHATGAAVAYGTRYLLKMIFNVAVGEDDDDGNGTQVRPDVKAPAGYMDWWTDLEIVAADGVAALESAWAASKPEYKRHLVKVNGRGWDFLKAKAKAVK